MLTSEAPSDVSISFDDTRFLSALPKLCSARTKRNEDALTMLASSEATAAREREFYRSARAVVCLRMCTFLFVAVAMRWVDQPHGCRATDCARECSKPHVPAPAAPAMP